MEDESGGFSGPSFENVWNFEENKRFGLPLSRIYCRYFSGEMILVSLPKYGTDVTIRLKKSPHDAKENVPSWSEKVLKDIYKKK